MDGGQMDRWTCPANSPRCFLLTKSVDDIFWISVTIELNGDRV